MRELPRDLLQRIRNGGSELAVLVVRLGAFGDILRTLPPVRLLRRQVPDARIDWIVDDTWAGFFRGHPDLNEVIALPRRGSGLTRVRDTLRCAGGLRERRFDLVLDFHGNLRSGVLGFLSSAPVRLGYGGHQQKEGNRLFTTHRVPSGSRRVSRMERNLDLVRALGVPDAPLPDGGLPSRDGDRAEARAMRDVTVGPGPFALLSPGASRGQAYKKPPAALLAAAAKELGRSGVPTLVVHGPGEEADAAAVIALAGADARMAPPTTLAQLAELLREARAFVGGDTGPLHLACAVRCPVVGIYGPTDPSVNAPWGVPFAAVSPPGREYTGIKKIDRAAGGFLGLTAPLVEDAVRGLLQQGSRDAR